MTEEDNRSFIQDFIFKIYQNYIAGKSIKAELEELIEKVGSPK